MSVGLGSSPSMSCCHYLLLQVELHDMLLYKSARSTDLLQCLAFVATFGMPQALWRAEGLGMIASLHAEYGHLTTFHSRIIASKPIICSIFIGGKAPCEASLEE